MDEFQIKTVDDIVIVKVDLFTATFRDVKSIWNFFETHLIFNQRKIILDLSFSHYIDSTFIGMIIKIFKKVSKKKGNFKLVYPQLHSIEAFRVIGITNVLSCYDTLNQAREAMNADTSEQDVELNILAFTN